MVRSSRREFLASATAAAFLRRAAAQGDSRSLTRAEKTAFLKTAKIVESRAAPRGITGTLRLTLTDSRLTHHASFQSIDESKATYQTQQGTELNFRDCWKFNLAAYRLDAVLGLHMIPVTVERQYLGRSGSLTWWVDDVLGTELDRRNKKLSPPDGARWSCQMHLVRVFDQLICNMDRNLGNLVIDKDWRIWMIDHTRAFRIRTDLPEPKALVQCERGLLESLKTLDSPSLQELNAWLRPAEVSAILKRRDAIVAHFGRLGPSSLYDFERRTS